VDNPMSDHNVKNRCSPFSGLRLVVGGALSIAVLAGCDGANLFGDESSVNRNAPIIEITEPLSGSSVPLAALRVRINVRDQSGIKSVKFEGYSIRGDTTTNSSVVTRFVTQTVDFPQPPSETLPRDTTLIRFLELAPGDIISEPVTIKVTAEDSTGAVSTALTQVLLGGPAVQLRSPTNNTQVQTGLAMTVSAHAYDPSGIDSMEIVVSGAQTQTFAWGGLAATDSVIRSASLDITAPTGTLEIVARAWNGSRVPGQSATSTVSIVTVASNDTTLPLVSMLSSSQSRLELLERHSVTVSARHNGGSGLRRLGAVVRAIPANTAIAPQTLYLDSIFTGSARTGLETVNFQFTLSDFGYTETTVPQMPFDVTFQIHAFAFSGAGRCAANIGSTLNSFPCDSVQFNGRAFGTVAGNSGLQQRVTAVAGYQVRDSRLNGSTIADVTLDEAHNRLYMSNWSRNRVEVLRLSDSTFADAVSVGSQPWGMFINNAGNRLIVANSGGTNISFVDISGATMPTREQISERLLTPNLGLFNVRVETTDVGTRYTVTRFDFSDRPQFIAQDNTGRLLYSTEPTAAAAGGTVRVVDTSLPRQETRLLYTRDAIIESDNTTAIAHIDSIALNATGTSVELFDHIPGTTTVISSALAADLNLAVDALRAQGSDIAAYPGAWDIQRVGLSDTTYVAASGDRAFVAFGEGASAPFADVWLWNAGTSTVSDAISVADLVGNAAEQVLGVSLNRNGRLGAARGLGGAFFFSNNADFEGDLRLQGVFDSPLQAGGSGGVALHPLHTEVRASDLTTLAFVASSDSTIKIVDTFHFRSRGSIAIKGTMVGPLRAGLPLPGENTGLSACDQIEVKLYGLMRTVEGSPPAPQTRAVIINVRRKDIADSGC